MNVNLYRITQILWLVVSNMNVIFHLIYGISSFPLRNSFFPRWLLHQQTSILSSFIFHERLWGNYESSFCHQQIQPLIGLKSMPQWHQLQEAVSKMEGAKLQNILFGWCFGTCFYVSIYWEYHHPNWRRNIFQRGRYTTNQRISCEFYPLVN